MSATIEMCLYTMFATDVFDTFTLFLGVSDDYVVPVLFGASVYLLSVVWLHLCAVFVMHSV